MMAFGREFKKAFSSKVAVGIVTLLIGFVGALLIKGQEYVQKPAKNETRIEKVEDSVKILQETTVNKSTYETDQAVITTELRNIKENQQTQIDELKQIRRILMYKKD
jgi:flagellar basal body-associated protein FliL